MFGPEYEIIKEYKPNESEIIESKNILDNEVEKLINDKHNKPTEKEEVKEDIIKDIIKPEERPEDIKEYKESEIKDETDKLIDSKDNKPSSKEELERKEDKKDYVKKPTIINKMFGTEFEFIKEYKPYESKSEIIENIINNDVEELIDVKQNKPIIKPEEKLEKETKKIKKKEKQPIKEIKEESTIKEELSKETKEKPDKLSKELKEDINRLININKMYGPEYEIIKEYEKNMNHM